MKNFYGAYIPNVSSWHTLRWSLRSDKHAELLDILEVPSLQDTCVRHGNYDEALDLESFVSRMVAAHAADRAA